MSGNGEDFDKDEFTDLQIIRNYYCFDCIRMVK